MWPLAVDAASNWRERQRFRSRSSHLIPTLYSGTRSRPPQTSANVCLAKVSLEVPELDYLWENSSLDRLDFLTFEAFLWSSWLTQFSCNEEAGRWLSPGNEAKENKLLVAGWINDNLSSCTEEDLKKECGEVWAWELFCTWLDPQPAFNAMIATRKIASEKWWEPPPIYRYWWWYYNIIDLMPTNVEHLAFWLSIL